MSARRACRWLGVHRTPIRYQSRRSTDTEFRVKLRALADAHPRRGVLDNYKRIERLYREDGVAVRRRRRTRVTQPRVARPAPEAANERRSMDFVRDTISSGRAFRALTLVDDFTRGCLHIEVDTSLLGLRVARVLEQIAVTRRLPQSIVVDNGPEFAGRVLDTWAHQRGVAFSFIQPGKPTQNCYIERVSGLLRDECLNRDWFRSLVDARRTIEGWRERYNSARSHSGLAGRIPSEFAALQLVKSTATRLSA